VVAQKPDSDTRTERSTPGSWEGAKEGEETRGKTDQGHNSQSTAVAHPCEKKGCQNWDQESAEAEKCIPQITSSGEVVKQHWVQGVPRNIDKLSGDPEQKTSSDDGADCLSAANQKNGESGQQSPCDDNDSKSQAVEQKSR
jgi:hypothetical protein